MGCCKNVLLSKEVWFRKIRVVCFYLENKGKGGYGSFGKGCSSKKPLLLIVCGEGAEELQVWREETFTSCVMFFPTIGNILP